MLPELGTAGGDWSPQPSLFLRPTLGQEPPELFLAALAGAGANPAVLGELPKIPAAPSGLTPVTARSLSP